ncbi:efflux RND transporter periplasmic adaptor subunit [Ramlibacter albus]|uniref:HlyD family efflux transporter periplasmic adaptor subunit n=1 Tax=Ramlibacter albus TaxID=2079448 RepID=A0A923M5X7_9BURK|nr:HlyD family efflux transporter periplasmic adaptor subunit [Ramlibacter albus]MBC5763289.1 HlyD family efflux transporter periplasmic adaptor subunit [Ramlibacter albus]
MMTDLRLPAARVLAAGLLAAALGAQAQAPAAVNDGTAARNAPAAAAARAASVPAAAIASSSGDVRVLVVAEQEATLSSQMGRDSRVTAMPRQVGDTFRAGDLLVAFDCSERVALVKEAEAKLLRAREIHLSKLKQQSLGAVADIDVVTAAADAETARAQLESAKAQERQCTIPAPFPGLVVRTRAHAHEVVKPGEPLLDILNTASLRVQLYVPSSWVRWVRPGTRFKVQIDETGATYNAQVSKISGRIDGSSQTVELLGRFDRMPARVLPGMIGKATFEGAPR